MIEPPENRARRVQPPESARLIADGEPPPGLSPEVAAEWQGRKPLTRIQVAHGPNADEDSFPMNMVLRLHRQGSRFTRARGAP